MAKKPAKKTAPARKPVKAAKASSGPPKPPKLSQKSHNSRLAKTSEQTAPGSRTGRLPAFNNSREPAFTPKAPPVPVPTDGKPRKNQVGFTTKELEHYRDLLLAKRRELVGDMSQMEREALRSAAGTNLSNLPLHMADMGTDNYEQEFTLGLVEKDRQLLREINNALAKIMDGTFGICEGTGKPIGRPRLEAQPWARYSIEFARQKEQGFHRMG